MAGLNPQQQRAADHPGGPLMVLAGAGSGKTRVLVHRIAGLLRSGIRPEGILAVTFTNKAAGEMRDRLEGMLGWSSRSMWISTFHSTCVRILRRYHQEVGLTSSFAIYDGDDQLKILKQLLKERSLTDVITPKSLAGLIDRAKNRGEDPVEAYLGHYADDIVAEVYPAYQERLAREDAVDFNDLLLKVLELQKHADIGPQLALLFEHVLVDEFQDTNLVQFDLVRHFVSQTGNLTVVGDDDQSIYSWRGAEPRNLLDFERSYPGATAIRLEQNYRSTQVILDAANGVIRNNYDRHEKSLWTERGGGELVLWEECADERGESTFIANAIRGLCSEEGRGLGDMAVLYRTHAQSRSLEETLRAYDIDYRIVGGVSFFQRREVKDIRGYLRLIINSKADLAFLRVINTPTRGIGKTTIDRLRGFAVEHDLSLLESARAAARGRVPSIKGAAAKKVGHFVGMLDGLKDVAEAGASVAELIIQVVERSGYRDRLEKDDSSESRDRLDNLSQLVSMASDYDESAGEEGSMVGFEERISLASVNDSEDGRGTAVTLMTIHAAKGLEFPVVFVAGLEDGLFPSHREREQDSGRALEEERRLAYVAFTRAMDRLVLTSARSRRHWNEVRFNRPSRFLDEIPSQCIAIREGTQPVRRVVEHGDSRRARGTDNNWEFDQTTDWDDDVPDFDIGDAVVSEANVGSRVRHSSFGRGKVLESRGEGGDRKLLINFHSVGLKTVLARFVDVDR